MSFVLKQVKKVKLSNPILIEGLPGIGNVGKIAVDFIIDNISAEKAFEIHSHSFPHAVFVNEKNLVELPTIEIYHKKVGNKDLLFLAGDIQPIDEQSCYEFCEVLLNFLQKNKCKEIVTLGGIGLHEIPESPKVFATGNDRTLIQKYKDKNVSTSIYGVVGPIVGVTGLLVGLAERWNIPSVALLGETFGHPQYLGIKGAREILIVLDKKFGLKLRLNELNSEIKEIEQQISKKVSQLEKLQKEKRPLGGAISETSYIG